MNIASCSTHLTGNAVRDIDVKDVGQVKHGVGLKKVFDEVQNWQLIKILWFLVTLEFETYNFPNLKISRTYHEVGMVGVAKLLVVLKGPFFCSLFVGKRR